MAPRTIYRDVADLQLSGVPIEGEAGVGYTLRKGSDVPPLMFTRAELEALVVGARFTRAFAEAASRGRPARPSPRSRRCCRRTCAGGASAHASSPPPWGAGMSSARASMLCTRPSTRGGSSGCVMRGTTASPRHATSSRCAWPSGGGFGPWAPGAACAEGFRNFRVDRILEMKATSEEITPDRTRDLRAYLAAVGASPDFEV